MDENQFWSLVQSAHDSARGDMDEKCELIKASITQLTPAEAAEFSRLFRRAMSRAYDWQLWGAAYVIDGGCSDDSFIDFRASLISRGRVAFDRALANPDSLADEDSEADDWFYEGYQYAVSEGVEAVAGPDVALEPQSVDPSGDPWDEDEVYALFPRLAEKYA